MPGRTVKRMKDLPKGSTVHAVVNEKGVQRFQITTKGGKPQTITLVPEVKVDGPTDDS